MVKRIKFPGFPAGVSVRVIGAIFMTVGIWGWVLTKYQYFNVITALGVVIIAIGDWVFG